jgi:hypothetical protein
MIVNDEYVRIRKEVVVAYFKYYPDIRVDMQRKITNSLIRTDGNSYKVLIGYLPNTNLH